MKKKILSFLLVAMMSVSLTACNKGGAETVPETTAPEETSAVTTAPDAEDISEETTTAETEPPKPQFEVVDVGTVSLQGDCVTFRIDETYYAYNVNANNMFEVNEEWKGDLYFNNKIVRRNGSSNVFNIETGEKILSDDEGTMIHYCADKLLVSKYEESFEGNTLSFGLINNEGEWLYELSDSYKISASTDGYNKERYRAYIYYVFGETLLIYADDGCYIYSFKNDELTHIGRTRLDKVDKDYIFYVNEEKPDELIRVDGTSGESSVVYKYNSNDIACMVTNNSVIIRDATNWKILDKESLNEYNFDLSAYNVVNIIDACEDRIIFVAKNPDGYRYTIIMNKDGSFVIDPFKESYIEFSKLGIWFVDDMIVHSNILSVDDSFILNCSTGEMLKSKENDYYRIVNYYDEAKMILVYKDSSTYLVDIFDPNTLINPFERANG